MSRLLIAVVLLVVYASPVFAQTNPVSAGQAFQVQFTHDGTGSPTAFRCAVDGKPLTPDLASTARVCGFPARRQARTR